MTVRTLLLACLAAAACGGGGGGAPALPDTLPAPPAPPLEVALEFSGLLALNDPACFDLLSPGLGDSVRALGADPRTVFGTWRGFDASGRLTEIITDSTGSRTSYYCSISRTELPALVRIDFLLSGGGWTIEGFGEEIPGEVIDSLTTDRMARMIMACPQVRYELLVARQLLDDCSVDSAAHFSSAAAAAAMGTALPGYVASLDGEAYSGLAWCNVRRAAKYQIIQDRATYNMTTVPVELNGFVASWREMAFLSKAVLADFHESMQICRTTGDWPAPDSTLDPARLAALRESFMAVSDLVQELDTLGGAFPAMVTVGDEEPLEQMIIHLDPHMTEQRFENEIGMTVWRALGVEMNGDQDPEKVVYFAGNLFLYQGTPSGYRLVWRTYDDYESDYHAEFSSRPSQEGTGREVTLVGSSGACEYSLSLGSGVPVFRRVELGTTE
jgi:hypothetical protein